MKTTLIGNQLEITVEGDPFDTLGESKILEARGKNADKLMELAVEQYPAYLRAGSRSGANIEYLRVLATNALNLTVTVEPALVFDEPNPDVVY